MDKLCRHMVVHKVDLNRTPLVTQSNPCSFIHKTSIKIGSI
jgi:hypothetical protein